VAIVTVYRNGATAGMAGRNPSPAKRDVIKGWSSASVRRHTKWLYSIDAPALDGVGYAVTLTMRDTPGSADELHAARRAWIMRVTRMGASRIHWVIEWQRRGTPHIHAAVYFPEDKKPQFVEALMLTAWVDVTDQWGSSLFGQYYDVISGPLGWLKYLSKHASRGVRHYQRMGAPTGWERTGRLWGHTGEWPVDAPMKFDMSKEAYWRYRRLVRSWRIANARQSGDKRRIVYARKMLQSSDPRLSAVRGVSDWVPEEVAVEFVALLVAEGFDVKDHVEPSEDSA
jgi:hypothetical protein